MRRFTVSMNRGEMAAAVLMLAFAIAILWGALLMPPGTPGSPGPGFFPRGLGALLTAVSVGLIVRALRLKPADDARVPLGHRDIVLTVVALAIYGLIFEPAGFVLSSTLFMWALLRAFSTLGWVRSLVVGAAIALAGYFFFVKLLGVTLPRGVLPF